MTTPSSHPKTKVVHYGSVQIKVPDDMETWHEGRMQFTMLCADRARFSIMIHETYAQFKNAMRMEVASFKNKVNRCSHQTGLVKLLLKSYPFTGVDCDVDEILRNCENINAKFDYNKLPSLDTIDEMYEPFFKIELSSVIIYDEDKQQYTGLSQTEAMKATAMRHLCEQRKEEYDGCLDLFWLEKRTHIQGTIQEFRRMRDGVKANIGVVLTWKRHCDLLSNDLIRLYNSWTHNLDQHIVDDFCKEFSIANVPNNLFKSNLL